MPIPFTISDYGNGWHVVEFKVTPDVAVEWATHVNPHFQYIHDMLASLLAGECPAYDATRGGVMFSDDTPFFYTTTSDIHAPNTMFSVDRQTVIDVFAKLCEMYPLDTKTELSSSS